jgi:hypothetical protein
MTAAATHLDPWLTVTLAAIVLLGMAWYWPRLAAPEIPRLRRRIRRASLLVGCLGVIGAALGFGLIDPDRTPIPYLFAWAGAGLAIGAVVLLAIIDALVSVRIHRRAMGEVRRESARQLGRAIDEARARRMSVASDEEEGAR